MCNLDLFSLQRDDSRRFAWRAAFHMHPTRAPTRATCLLRVSTSTPPHLSLRRHSQTARRKTGVMEAAARQHGRRIRR